MSYVYFYETPDGHIYNGWTVAPETRHAAHKNNGDTLMLAMPGTGGGVGTLEDEICKFFGPPVRGNSTFGGEAIWQYIEWLALRGYGAGTFDDARRLPLLPLDVTHPRNSGSPQVGGDGQASFFLDAPSRQRRIIACRHIYYSSKSNEYNTPPDIINGPVRRTFPGGIIDTDPASNYRAQSYIQAKVWYSEHHDGLNPDHPWRGNLWMNPPYGRDGRKELFIERLIAERASGNVRSAIVLLSAMSVTAKWFDRVADTCDVLLSWRDRIPFNGPTETKDSGLGSVFAYYGDDEERFVLEFGPYGNLWLPYRRCT